MNKHEQIKELIAIYESLSRSEQARIDQHLQSCPTCRTQLDAYRKMDSGLDKLLDPKPAAHLRSDFYARLEGERPKQNGFRYLLLPFLGRLSGQIAQVGALAVLVVIVFSMWLALRSRSEQPAAVPSLTAVAPRFSATPTPDGTATPAPPTVVPTPAPPAWFIQQQSTLSGQLNVVRAVTIGAEGQFIAASGSSFFMVVWEQVDDSYQYQQMMQKEAVYGAALNSLSFSSPEYLAFGGASGLDGLVSVLNPGSGEEVYALPTAVPPVKSVEFSNGGEIIAVGTGPSAGEQYGAVYLWFLDFSDRLYALDFEGDSAIALAFSPDDSLVAAVSPLNVSLWQVEGNNFIRAFTADENEAPRFSSLAFAPDGQTLAAGTQQGAVYLWQMADGQELGQIDTGTAPIQSVAFSADGQLLATVSANGQVTVWQLGGSGPELLFRGETAERAGLATDVAFIGDSVLAAVGLADGQVQLWQAMAGKSD